MILDTGICTVFHAYDTAQPGEMPRKGYSLLCQSWYGELSRNEQRVDSRIRILQNRAITQDDVVVLAQVDDVASDAVIYRITRAYHGVDADGPTPITDLTLEVISP